MSDYDQSSDGEKGWIQKIQESPRTVTVLLIILIAAAAIYAFSGDEQTPGELSGGEEVAMEEADSDDDLAQGDSDSAEASQGEEGSMEKMEMKELPPAERMSDGYKETAQPGEGITHLARRATSNYLADNSVSYEVTKEHRIYIEDYIQNKIGTHGLALGEQVTVTDEMIAEAIDAASQLTESQLHNLSKYTSVLP